MIQKIIPFDVERLDRSNVKLNIQVKNIVITVPKITRVFSTFPLKFLYTITNLYIKKPYAESKKISDTDGTGDTTSKTTS
jgi:hypothetical protein